MPAKDSVWRSRLIGNMPALAGVALTLLTVLALGFLGWSEHREILKSDMQRAALQARVLEDHATRSIELASLSLNYLTEQLVNADVLGGEAKAAPMLTQALASLPFVRSINVLDASGRILASSTPADAGLTIALDRLGSTPGPGQELLGGYFPGRSLAALVPDAKQPAGPAEAGFIPLVRTLRAKDDQNYLLVALFNPDYFSVFQGLTLSSEASGDASTAYLLSYQGEVLASSGAARLLPGKTLARHPVFLKYLPQKTQASYVGDGALADQQVVAFKMLKARPLVVLVEQPYAASFSRWFSSVRWFGLAGVLTVIFLAVMSVTVYRSLRLREKADAELGAARLDLMRRERELRVLVKSVQELIFRTDVRGAITYVNDRWAVVRGQSTDQAINSLLTNLVDPADRDAVASLFAPDNGTGVRTATANMRSNDGTVRRFDFAVVPLRTSLQITGFAGSAVDVTDRVTAEKGLQQQLAFVGLLLESCPFPVATLNKRGEYVTANRAWDEFIGRRPDLVEGQAAPSFASKADAAFNAHRDVELWRTGGSARYETKIDHVDGSLRDVVVTKVMLAGDEYREGTMLCTVSDVTEFREAERATLEARDSAEESSRAKSEFIANISHELRTPLQTILGFSELGVTRGRDYPKLQGMFADIHASGVRMLALVNDLLDVSKIESAIGAITLERADLRPLVHSVMRELSPLLTGKKLKLMSELGDEPLIAKVDPVRFQQVIRNVTANAIKFSPAGAEIEVLGQATDDSMICISVRDHGNGIPASELEKIFGAFVQSSTTKDGSGGTGLGLAICRKIMEAHGGSIVADNMPNGGAVFNMYLPMRHYLDRDTTLTAPSIF